MAEEAGEVDVAEEAGDMVAVGTVEEVVDMVGVVGMVVGDQVVEEEAAAVMGVVVMAVGTVVEGAAGVATSVAKVGILRGTVIRVEVEPAAVEQAVVAVGIATTVARLGISLGSVLTVLVDLLG